MTKIIDLSVKEKIYKSKKAQISILNNFRLEVAPGERIAIVGESGAGKSSLLNIIGLLDRNYVGEYTLFGSPTAQLHTSQLAQWRNQRIGFVLQESALINSLTIEDNIKLPFLYAGSEKMDLSETENFEAVVSAILPAIATWLPNFANVCAWLLASPPDCNEISLTKCVSMSKSKGVGTPRTKISATINPKHTILLFFGLSIIPLIFHISILILI